MCLISDLHAYASSKRDRASVVQKYGKDHGGEVVAEHHPVEGGASLDLCVNIWNLGLIDHTFV